MKALILLCGWCLLRALLAGGTPGSGTISVRLAALIAITSHWHHAGGGVCLPSGGVISPGTGARSGTQSLTP